MNTAEQDIAIRLLRLSTGYVVRGVPRVLSTNLTADLMRGELTCLLGPNGVGKSTLLRTLTAFQPSLGGQIVINGRPLEQYSNKEIARTIGVVLTNRVDVQDMTVTDLVSLGRSPYTGFWGTLTDADARAVSHALRLTATESLADRPLSTLSDGERQRVMIAKALAQQTSIVCLDEPTAFLDYPTKVMILRLLRRLCRETSAAIFLSTHDLDLALQLADRIWLMHTDGNLSVGTPYQLAANGNLARCFACPGLEFRPETLTFRVQAD